MPDDASRGAVPTLPKLLHVIGYPSSGTKLLRTILDAHSAIRLTEEMPLLPMLRGKLPSQVSSTNFDDVKQSFLKTDIYRSFQNRALLFSDLSKIFGPAGYYTPAHVYTALIDGRPYTYYGNTTPQYSESLPLLLGLFPSTKLILIVRDIRDVALSFRKRWGKNEILCAHKWRERMEMALRTLSTLPSEQSYILRYEDLLREPQRVIAEVFEFLDMGHVKALTIRPDDKDDKQVIMDDRSNYVVRLNASRVGNWCQLLPQVTARRVEEVSFDLLEKFNYIPRFATGSRPLSKLRRLVQEFGDMAAAFSPFSQYPDLPRERTLFNVAATLKRRLYVR